VKVYVYFNLRTHLWSVQAREGTQRGRVVAHCEALRLRGVTFHVSEAARQRVIAKRCREVHAGCIGEWDASDVPGAAELGRAFSYNPYTAGHFYARDDMSPLHEARECVFVGRVASFR
jgi:hypothetical protein